MTDRHLPVRPSLRQLKRQAKELLRRVRAGDSGALAELAAHLPRPSEDGHVQLADVQFALARSYGLASWPRLVQACALIDAIWRDKPDGVRKLIAANPQLLHEMARGGEACNWGPPMSYAANLGRNRIIQMLHEMGARDHSYAIGRAALQSETETARLLYELAGSPPPPESCLAGPAYTLSVPGTRLMFELGAKVYDDQGVWLAPVDVVLETDGRNPSSKHAILEIYAEHGFVYPDTPTMALHRGRIDLLEAHLMRNPDLLRRTFSHEEIYPPELGCHDEVQATHGTPLAGATLLHMCVDYDELEIARWLLDHEMDPDAKAAVDADGFGGHTPLFATVVSQPNHWMNFENRSLAAPFTQLLLDHGANPNVRASLRKQLHPGYAPTYDTATRHEYRNVTPLSWGQRFHAKIFVSELAMQLIAEHGGHD